MFCVMCVPSFLKSLSPQLKDPYHLVLYPGVTVPSFHTRSSQHCTQIFAPNSLISIPSFLRCLYLRSFVFRRLVDKRSRRETSWIGRGRSLSPWSGYPCSTGWLPQRRPNIRPSVTSVRSSLSSASGKNRDKTKS